MKRMLALGLTLMLLLLPFASGVAEENQNVYAPGGAGIELVVGEWIEQVQLNLYTMIDRPDSEPVEYSDILFVTIDENGEAMPAFALSNRVIGSAHTPLETMDSVDILQSDGEREVALFAFSEPEGDEATVSCMTIPVEWLRAHPEDVRMSAVRPLIESGFEALYGFNALDGTEVTARELLGYKVIMLNVWTTYCNWCLTEMPDLSKLNEAYADQGLRVIGIVTDAGTSEQPNEDQVALAKRIIEATGADYLHIVPGESLMMGALKSITAVPTTFFVDENGEQIGEAYMGSRSYDEWASIVETLLTEAQ